MEVEHGIWLLSYIDPGLGSLVIQVAAAAVLSAGLFFKGLRERLGYLFYMLLGRKNDRDHREHAAEETPAKRLSNTPQTGKAA